MYIEKFLELSDEIKQETVERLHADYLVYSNDFGFNDVTYKYWDSEYEQHLRDTFGYTGGSLFVIGEFVEGTSYYVLYDTTKLDFNEVKEFLNDKIKSKD